MTGQASLFGGIDPLDVGDRQGGALSADGWAMWLAVERMGHVGTTERMAQMSGIAPQGQLVTKPNRNRAADALIELEDAEYIRRVGSSYRVLGPPDAPAAA